MQSELQRWTETDWEILGWHDCNIYGFSFAEGNHGTGSLTFDLDYILEWRKTKSNHFEFLIAPADLVFHEVWAPVIELDYSSCAMGPFSIDGIQRDLVKREHYSSYRWTIDVNFPKGSISFEALSFVQTLRKEPILTSAQLLTPEERGDA